jgi:hypothetical protein
MSNTILKTCRKELAAHGLKLSVEHRRKHLKLSWGVDAQQSMICAATPSDWRAERNAVGLLRRKLREPSPSKSSERTLTVLEPAYTPVRTRQAPNPMRSRNRVLAVSIRREGEQANIEKREESESRKCSTKYTIDYPAVVRQAAVSVGIEVNKLLPKATLLFLTLASAEPSRLQSAHKTFRRIFKPLRIWLPRCPYDEWPEDALIALEETISGHADALIAAGLASGEYSETEVEEAVGLVEARLEELDADKLEPPTDGAVTAEAYDELKASVGML